MSELAILVHNTPDYLNICIETSLATFSELQVLNADWGLSDILHSDSSYWGISHTISRVCILYWERNIDGLSCE